MPAGIGQHLCEGVRFRLIRFKHSVPHPKVEIGGTVLLFNLLNFFINVAQVNPIVQISYEIVPMSQFCLGYFFLFFLHSVFALVIDVLTVCNCNDIFCF